MFTLIFIKKIYIYYKINYFLANKFVVKMNLFLHVYLKKASLTRIIQFKTFYVRYIPQLCEFTWFF